MSISAKSHPVLGFFLKGYPRLSETFIANEILQLERLGFRIHIFALRDPQESKVHESVQKIEAPVTYISDYPWRAWWAFLRANVGLWWQRPKIYGAALRWAVEQSVRLRDSGVLKRFIQAAYAVQVVLPEAEIAHFHAHFANDPTTVVFFIHWLTGIPYSFTGHAKDIYTQDVGLLQEKLRRARFTATCTGFNGVYLRQVAGEETAVYTIYHGTDLAQFGKNGRFAPVNAPQAPVILSVGRLVPKKGFPTLLHALAILQQRQVDFVCFIVGSGPQKNKLHGLVEELGLTQKVDLCGNLTQVELRRYYETAAVMALACQVEEDGDRDGIPNVLVEAMAMGTPVVSTAVSGIPELVRHEETGLLVPPNDPEALADALQRVLAERPFAHSLADAGQHHVHEHFDMVDNARQLGQLFHHALTAPEAGKLLDHIPFAVNPV